mmetsp:Transcript_4806/g.11561  ORF Transcript_4806/g.11561 Transcript_4806/m.11561 type:complete len:357 (+) Transcript_4806:3367-4437(+)
MRLWKRCSRHGAIAALVASPKSNRSNQAAERSCWARSPSSRIRAFHSSSTLSTVKHAPCSSRIDEMNESRWFSCSWSWMPGSMSPPQVADRVIVIGTDPARPRGVLTGVGPALKPPWERALSMSVHLARSAITSSRRSCSSLTQPKVVQSMSGFLRFEASERNSPFMITRLCATDLCSRRLLTQRRKYSPRIGRHSFISITAVKHLRHIACSSGWEKRNSSRSISQSCATPAYAIVSPCSEAGVWSMRIVIRRMRSMCCTVNVEAGCFITRERSLWRGLGSWRSSAASPRSSWIIFWIDSCFPIDDSQIISISASPTWPLAARKSRSLFDRRSTSVCWLERKIPSRILLDMSHSHM